MLLLFYLFMDTYWYPSLCYTGEIKLKETTKNLTLLDTLSTQPLKIVQVCMNSKFLFFFSIFLYLFFTQMQISYHCYNVFEVIEHVESRQNLWVLKCIAEWPEMAKYLHHDWIFITQKFWTFYSPPLW